MAEVLGALLPPQNTPMVDVKGTITLPWYRYFNNISLSGTIYAGTANQIQVSSIGQISIVDNPVIPGTGAITIPVGTTAQRPSPASNGDIRYNSTIDDLEYYKSGTWNSAAPDSVLTTKGDILTYSTVPARLPVGSNNQYLVVNSSTATGLQWKSTPYRLLYVNSGTSTSTTTGSDETLYTYTLSSNTLSTAGDFLKIKSSINTAATADAKTIEIHFGGSAIASLTDTLNDSNVVFELEIYRQTAGIQRVTGKILYDTSVSTVVDFSLVNLSSNADIELICNVSNVGDVIGRTISIEGVFNV